MSDICQKAFDSIRTYRQKDSSFVARRVRLAVPDFIGYSPLYSTCLSHLAREAL
jgi:hypothetical protein